MSMGAPDGIDRDIDREAVATFLKQKGSIELLIVVAEGGAQYTEIDERTRIAESTLALRLRQGVEAGVIADKSRRTDGEREDVYVLTPLGLAIREHMHEARMAEVFWRLMELRKRFDESKDDIIEYVENTESPLEEITARMMTKEGMDEPRDAREYFWESY